MEPNPQTAAPPWGAGTDYYNHEHYADPTAWEAVCNLEREEQQQEAYESRVSQLNAFRLSLDLVKSLSEQLIEMRTLSCNAALALQPWPCRLPPDPDTAEPPVKSLLQAQKRLERQIEKNLALQRQLLQLIDRVASPLGRQVLRLRYLNGLCLTETARQMGIEHPRVWHLHRMAVNQLNNGLAS